MNKICIECGNELKGRIDRKFCSDSCKNKHNNSLKTEFSRSTRVINGFLRNNRKVLKELKHGTKVSKTDLLNNGFNFKYFTHIFETPKNETYYYCYEYGYKPIGNDLYFVVKEKG